VRGVVDYGLRPNPPYARSTYQKSGRVQAALEGYVDDAVAFTVGRGRQGSGFTLAGSQIKFKRIELAVPSTVSKTQLSEINAAIKYGAQNGVIVNVTKIR
jgi:hypothetical protein